jgi:CobQ-like glutamine amidotransferase family enzyme
MTALTLVHLYPQHMNIYGDTGNVVVLQQRLLWRGLTVEVVPVSIGDPIPSDADIILGGGGQDAAQGEIGIDFVSRRATLKAMADDGVVMLAICGTYQLLGHEFLTFTGDRIEGAGVIDVTTAGSQQRLIGNNSIETTFAGRLVGYENHSGLTTLGPGAKPLGQTIEGRGNNGADRTEGAVYNNIFGTYLHGPVLAKSPQFADELIHRAYARRSNAQVLTPLDDSLELRAAEVALRRPR